VLARWVKKHHLSSLRVLGTVGEPINPEVCGTATSPAADAARSSAPPGRRPCRPFSRRVLHAIPSATACRSQPLRVHRTLWVPSGNPVLIHASRSPPNAS